MYFLNADNLNNNTTGDNRILGTYGIGGCWCGASYFTGHDGKGRVVSSGMAIRSACGWRRAAHALASTNLYFTSGITGDQAPGFFTAVSSTRKRTASTAVTSGR